MSTVESITSVHSLTEFENLLGKCASGNQLLLVDFYADWCGPCRAVAPQFQLIAEEFSTRHVVCAKVNADHAQDLCQREFVSALPTFKLYRNKECVSTVVGARMEQLRLMLEKHAMDPSIVQMMKTTDSKLRQSAAKTLLRIFRGVTLCPLSDENRHLKLSNPDFQECLLNVPGAMECLFAAGYQEADDCLVLPANEDLGRMKIMIEHLSGLCNESDNKGTHEASSPIGKAQQSVRSVTPHTKPAQSQNVGDVLGWMQFVNRLSAPIGTVSAYLDPEAREQARSIIPTEELMEAAAFKSGGTVDTITPRAFLRELLRWYKEEFFQWADSFECAQCKTKMQFAGTVVPTAEETIGCPGSVESYRCPANSTHPIYRFPRYNNVKTLLRTRLGRCGEWANCLTFLLSVCTRPSKGSATNPYQIPWFPACRYICDWTDHVWCEVWLEDEQVPGHYRWVHCDPGGEIDQPLLYEEGWGKKLTYVFAYTVPPPFVVGVDRCGGNGIDRLVDVQDVTWRYTRQFQQVADRRFRVLETRLATHLTKRHLAVSSAWNSMRQSFLERCGSHHPFSLEQVAREITSFLTPPAAPNERLPGRQTGSLEWRRARGELGSAEPTWRGSNVPLRPTPLELKQGAFFLRYNAALDIYQRPRSTENPTPDAVSRRSSVLVDSTALINEAKRTGLKGWHALATRWRNIARKVEHDWHMAYLAREEGSAAEYDGRIEWLLDLTGTGYTVGKVSLFANMVCHTADSRAQFTLCSSSAEPGKTEAASGPGGACVRLVPGANALFQVTDFMGAKSLRLEVRLWSELGETLQSDLAWQQSQLFRQKDTDFVLWPFEWNVELVREDATS